LRVNNLSNGDEGITNDHAGVRQRAK